MELLDVKNLYLYVNHYVRLVKKDRTVCVGELYEIDAKPETVRLRMENESVLLDEVEKIYYIGDLTDYHADTDVGEIDRAYSFGVQEWNAEKGEQERRNLRYHEYEYAVRCHLVLEQKEVKANIRATNIEIERNKGHVLNEDILAKGDFLYSFKDGQCKIGRLCKDEAGYALVGQNGELLHFLRTDIKDITVCPAVNVYVEVSTSEEEVKGVVTAVKEDFFNIITKESELVTVFYNEIRQLRFLGELTEDRYKNQYVDRKYWCKATYLHKWENAGRNMYLTTGATVSYAVGINNRGMIAKDIIVVKEPENTELGIILNFDVNGGGYIGKKYYCKTCGDANGNKGDVRFGANLFREKNEGLKYIYIVKYSLLETGSTKVAKSMEVVDKLEYQDYGYVEVTGDEVKAIPFYQAGINYYEGRKLCIEKKGGESLYGKLKSYDEGKVILDTGVSCLFEQVSTIKIIGKVTRFFEKEGYGYIDNKFWFNIKFVEESQREIIKAGSRVQYALKNSVKNAEEINAVDIRVSENKKAVVFAYNNKLKRYAIVEKSNYDNKNSRAEVEWLEFSKMFHDTGFNFKKKDYLVELVQDENGKSTIELVMDETQGWDKETFYGILTRICKDKNDDDYAFVTPKTVFEEYGQYGKTEWGVFCPKASLSQEVLERFLECEREDCDCHVAYTLGGVSENKGTVRIFAGSVVYTGKEKRKNNLSDKPERFDEKVPPVETNETVILHDESDFKRKEWTVSVVTSKREETGREGGITREALKESSDWYRPAVLTAVEKVNGKIKYGYLNQKVRFAMESLVCKGENIRGVRKGYKFPVVFRCDSDGKVTHVRRLVYTNDNKVLWSQPWEEGYVDNVTEETIQVRVGGKIAEYYWNSSEAVDSVFKPLMERNALKGSKVFVKRVAYSKWISQDVEYLIGNMQSGEEELEIQRNANGYEGMRSKTMERFDILGDAKKLEESLFAKTDRLVKVQFHLKSDKMSFYVTLEGFNPATIAMKALEDIKWDANTERVQDILHEMTDALGEMTDFCSDEEEREKVQNLLSLCQTAAGLGKGASFGVQEKAWKELYETLGMKRKEDWLILSKVEMVSVLGELKKMSGTMLDRLYKEEAYFPEIKMEFNEKSILEGQPLHMILQNGSGTQDERQTAEIKRIVLCEVNKVETDCIVLDGKDILSPGKTNVLGYLIPYRFDEADRFAEGQELSLKIRLEYSHQIGFGGDYNERLESTEIEGKLKFQKTIGKKKIDFIQDNNLNPYRTDTETDKYENEKELLDNMTEEAKKITRFFGRTDDLQKIRDGLITCNVNGNNELVPGRRVIIFGQKRCGKTSLLRKYLTEIETNFPKTILLEIDIRSITNRHDSISEFESYFYRTVRTEVKNKVEEILDEEGIDFSETELGKTVPAMESENARSYFVGNTEVKGFVDEFVEYFKKFTKEYKVVLFMDEFTVLCNEIKNKENANSYLDFIQQFETAGLIQIICGHEAMMDLFKKIDSNNGNHLLAHGNGQITLSALEPEAAKELITTPMEQLYGYNPYDTVLGEKAIQRLLEYSGGYPYTLKWICEAVLKEYNYSPNRYIVEADIMQVINTMILNMKQADYNTYFDQILSEAGDDDRRINDIKTFLVQLAIQSEEDRGCKETGLKVELKKKGFSERRVNELRKLLIKRDVITGEGGYLKLVLRIFEAVIKRNEDTRSY